ncbi:NAD(P)H-hydrate dehydratase [Candidatus Latescibacterota bacterium]
MKLLTAEQMTNIDRLTIERGTPGIDLMRNAGEAVFHLVKERATSTPHDRIVVLAGKGNNGGDGHRAAELLSVNGCQVELFLVGNREDVTGDALTCMLDAETAGLTVVEIRDSDGLSRAVQSINAADVIVDALFGTGLKGDLRGLAAEVVAAVNATSAVIVAVDVPSGVDASTGSVSRDTVKAQWTITFGCLKVGHLLGPGKQFCGTVDVEDIGFDAEIFASSSSFGNTLSAKEASALVPIRAYDAHKGDAGKVFILTGSVGLTGASTLSSRAALRSGAGLVTAGCPESLNDIIEAKLTEVMTLPLPEVRKKRCLSLRAMGMLRLAAAKADVVAIGPGLGRFHETSDLVRRFLADYDGRVVLDADGIHAFKGQADLLRKATCEIVLTPHVGELALLMDVSRQEIMADPVSAVRQAAEATGKTVLLKGAPSLIAMADGTLWVNPTGNEGMATAGMGDVLTGIITGFAAQGLDLHNAAVLGAYIHGMSGDLAKEIQGIHGMIAGDVLELLPEAVLDTLNPKPILHWKVQS